LAKSPAQNAARAAHRPIVLYDQILKPFYIPTLHSCSDLSKSIWPAIRQSRISSYHFETRTAKQLDRVSHRLQPLASTGFPNAPIQFPNRPASQTQRRTALKTLEKSTKVIRFKGYVRVEVTDEVIATGSQQADARPDSVNLRSEVSWMVLRKAQQADERVLIGVPLHNPVRLICRRIAYNHPL